MSLDLVDCPLGDYRPKGVPFADLALRVAVIGSADIDDDNVEEKASLGLLAPIRNARATANESTAETRAVDKEKEARLSPRTRSRRRRSPRERPTSPTPSPRCSGNLPTFINRFDG